VVQKVSRRRPQHVMEPTINIYGNLSEMNIYSQVSRRRLSKNSLKGQSHKMSELCFMIKHLPLVLGHWFIPYNIFPNGGKFAEMFAVSYC
jgi:hypothetical protein